MHRLLRLLAAGLALLLIAAALAPLAGQTPDTAVAFHWKKPTTGAFRAGFVLFRMQCYIATGVFFTEVTSRDTTASCPLPKPDPGDSVAIYVRAYWLNQGAKATLIGQSAPVTVTTPVVVVPPPPNQPPVADFTHACTSLTCAFRDASTDDGGIVSRSWHVAETVYTQAELTHTFLASGNKLVTLTVADSAGLTATVTRTVSVAGTTQPPPSNPPPTNPPTTPTLPPVTDTIAGSLPTANLLRDGLEGANKSARDPTGFNLGGFAWISGSGAAFSVVRDDGCVVWTSSNAPASSCGFTARQWQNAPGDSGHHALRASYNAKTAAFAEQRFDLGANLTDVWLRFDFRVPINYTHANVSGSSANNKFFAIWQDGYSQAGQGSTVVWEYWPNPDGSSRLSYHYSPGGLQQAGGHVGHTLFMGPAERGRWMQVVLHVRIESAPGASDGVIQLWRRWAGEPVFARVHDTSSAALRAAPTPGWRRGYFMGASNSWWAQQTEFLIDNVEVSTTPLIGGN